MQLSLFPKEHQTDDDALARCLRAEVVSVDIETDTRWRGSGPKLDYGLCYQSDVTVIALAWVEGDVIQTTAIAAPFDEAIRDFLLNLFTSPRWMVAHNAVFDIRQLSKLTGGIIPQKIWDTQSMARLLTPSVDARYSLLSVAESLNIAFPQRQQAMKSQRGKLHLLPLETTIAYAQDDARLTLEIYRKQSVMTSTADLVEWECKAVYEYCRMAAEGMRLNTHFVEKRIAELSRQRDKLATQLRTAGLHNPGSPKARAVYLHEAKNIPLPAWSPRSYFFTRAGRRRLRDLENPTVELSDLSMGADVIEHYLEKYPALADSGRALVEYLEVDWLLSTLKGLVEHAECDGRLHSLVNIATETGRRASSYPHMQNWKMPAMSGVAIGDEGFTLVEIDYRNAENIMAAMIASDSNLAAACVAEDFHSMMAEQYFGEAWDDADAETRKHLRGMSKKITYGTAYGMGAERLGESIGVSTDEAMRLIRAKDKAFANVTKIRAAAQRQVRQTNQLRLWTGRPVPVPTPFVAWNYLCQGGVSEMLKRSIVRVSEAFRERGFRSRVALDMHDAMILEVAHDEWDEALNIASEMMSNIVPERFLARTTPQIVWVAKPNLAENQHKWGGEQLHPT